MQRLSRLLLLASMLPVALSANKVAFQVLGNQVGSWPRILSSMGLLPSTDDPYVTVAPARTLSNPDWDRRVREGEILILEGSSPLGESLGFKATARYVSVTAMTDVHAVATVLIPAKPLQIKNFSSPAGCLIFSVDRWSDTPLMAGFKRGKGAVLWIASDPGPRGFDYYPYLAQALVDLGFEAPFRSSRIWAFFDYSYRTRVDLDVFASKWKQAGISALHVASWHFYETDPVRDAYLKQLIEACHRRGILVYAWLELPHVSEEFWAAHPEWREKTAVLQDAALDWRKLMNLANPDCFRATSTGIRAMLQRFDWDGVNLAELYFESLEGAANPARFTPMNPEIRRDFQKKQGFDPLELWSTRKDAASLRTFLDYRASLARNMQEQWLVEIEKSRSVQPDLDIVLTHVDDRLDPNMKDAIGADSSHILSLLPTHRFTFLIEDPATVWNLGPERYTEVAKRYPALPSLAIDINVVERYQDVYPTKVQTGIELLQLLHFASAAFPRLAVYCEHSIPPADLSLLSAATAVVTLFRQEGRMLKVDSPHGFQLPWTGGARVDGNMWAGKNPQNLLVPAGKHTIEEVPTGGPYLTDFNGELHSAHASEMTIELSYSASSRALATFDCDLLNLEVDGKATILNRLDRTLLLPSGDHTAKVELVRRD